MIVELYHQVNAVQEGHGVQTFGPEWAIIKKPSYGNNLDVNSINSFELPIQDDSFYYDDNENNYYPASPMVSINKKSSSSSKDKTHNNPNLIAGDQLAEMTPFEVAKFMEGGADNWNRYDIDELKTFDEVYHDSSKPEGLMAFQDHNSFDDFLSGYLDGKRKRAVTSSTSKQAIPISTKSPAYKKSKKYSPLSKELHMKKPTNSYQNLASYLIRPFGHNRVFDNHKKVSDFKIFNSHQPINQHQIRSRIPFSKVHQLTPPNLATAKINFRKKRIAERRTRIKPGNTNMGIHAHLVGFDGWKKYCRFPGHKTTSSKQEKILKNLAPNLNVPYAGERPYGLYFGINQMADGIPMHRYEPSRNKNKRKMKMNYNQYIYPMWRKRVDFNMKESDLPYLNNFHVQSHENGHGQIPMVILDDILDPLSDFDLKSPEEYIDLGLPNQEKRSRVIPDPNSLYADHDIQYNERGEPTIDPTRGSSFSWMKF